MGTVVTLPVYLQREEIRCLRISKEAKEIKSI